MNVESRDKHKYGQQGMNPRQGIETNSPVKTPRIPANPTSQQGMNPRQGIETDRGGCAACQR